MERGRERGREIEECRLQLEERERERKRETERESCKISYDPKTSQGQV